MLSQYAVFAASLIQRPLTSPVACLAAFPVANGALRDATHGYTASQIMFATLGFCGLIFSILLLSADRKEGGRLESAK